MPKSVIYTEMIILQPILTEQSFSFIPRSKTYDGLYLRGESTNIETEITITSSVNGDYYDTINATFVNGGFNLVKDNFYTLELRNGAEVVHKDKIFVTDQTPVVNYSVNDGQYISNISTNEFIIYE
tara:strand:- start:286 stop:663 length:378 start_codon:yes stop_codon:yes gene_type:complete